MIVSQFNYEQWTHSSWQNLLNLPFLMEDVSLKCRNIQWVVCQCYRSTSACTGRRSLRSATKGDFLVPRARTAIKQKRAFSIVGPSVWNDLPSELRSLPRDLSSSFYKLLKTLLFG